MLFPGDIKLYLDHAVEGHSWVNFKMLNGTPVIYHIFRKSMKYLTPWCQKVVGSYKFEVKNKGCHLKFQSRPSNDLMGKYLMTLTTYSGVIFHRNALE